GINKGLLKILSKMGISTISSYRGAQLFEIVGLGDEVVDLCFPGTLSRIGGARFEHLQKEQEKLSAEVWMPRRKVMQGGLLKFVHGGEYHMFNPDVVATLQAAVRSGDYEKYRSFAQIVDNRPISAIRDMLGLRSDVESIGIDQVEPLEDILKRFDSAG